MWTSDLYQSLLGKGRNQASKPIWSHDLLWLTTSYTLFKPLVIPACIREAARPKFYFWAALLLKSNSEMIPFCPWSIFWDKVCQVISLDSDKDQTWWLIQIQKHTSKGFRSNPCLKSQTSETRGEPAGLVFACLCRTAGGTLNLSLCLTPVHYRTSHPQAMIYFDFLISECIQLGQHLVSLELCVCVCAYMVSITIKLGTIWPVRTVQSNSYQSHDWWADRGR